MKKHIEIIERMMFAMVNHTVDGKRIFPTLKVAKEALEKQTPKRPIEDGYYDEPAVCPNCGESVIKLLDNNYPIQYCICCGQALNFADRPTEKGGEG